MKRGLPAAAVAALIASATLNGWHWLAPTSTTPPEVPVYYGGQAFSAESQTAIMRAAGLITATGYVILTPHNESGPAPCGQNRGSVVICSNPDLNAYWMQTGVGPIYEEPATHIAGASVWVRADIDAVAAERAFERRNALRPDGTCCGWSSQDWLNMAFCHEMLHTVGVGESNEADSCLSGATTTLGEHDLDTLAALYAFHEDAQAEMPTAVPPTVTPTPIPTIVPTATPHAPVLCSPPRARRCR